MQSDVGSDNKYSLMQVANYRWSTQPRHLAGTLFVPVELQNDYSDTKELDLACAAVAKHHPFQLIPLYF